MVALAIRYAVHKKDHWIFVQRALRNRSVGTHETFSGGYTRSRIEALRIIPLTKLNNCALRADERVGKISVFNASGIQYTVRDVRAYHDSISKVCVSENGGFNAGVTKIDGIHIGFSEFSLEEARIGEITACKVTTTKQAAGKVLAGVRAVKGLTGPVLGGVILATA